MVAFGSAPAVTSGVPSSKQKFRERSLYVRLQVGQRFILGVENGLSVRSRNQWSYIISHLSYIILKTSGFRQMTNDKCQMTYDH